MRTVKGVVTDTFRTSPGKSPPSGARRLAAPPRPRLRGVSHAFAAAAALVAWIALVTIARSDRARVAAMVYGGSLFTLFFVSALYHRREWSRRARRVIRALDHSAIYLLIAGTCTPLALLLPDPVRSRSLTLVWGGALLGVLKVTLWVRAPKKVGVALHVLVGWLGVSLFPPLWKTLGAQYVLLLALGGLAYTAGAFVYARRRPNPYPAVFGYHEVFHALVIAAAAGHFTVAAAAIVRMS
ncbi:PAQR family membrane homeostasis protein TrhA [Anaeromyxobacter oryzae]|uniref:Membrane protein n=1 Tax=Anaeromyxobacter oryzae TaxID=2918170 RepID=A0ABM7X251_9BACT|nr:hemolysin III family protein [Anaeromyxobacter oryzae]BDG05854.1 membrane protein [Anaeromyxobacter oryzae]